MGPIFWKALDSPSGSLSSLFLINVVGTFFHQCRWWLPTPHHRLPSKWAR